MHHFFHPQVPPAFGYPQPAQGATYTSPQTAGQIPPGFGNAPHAAAHAAGAVVPPHFLQSGFGQFGHPSSHSPTVTSPAGGHHWPNLNFLHKQPAGAAQTEFVPSVDVKDSSDVLVIHVEVPGVNTGDVQVTLKDGVLEITGKKEKPKTEAGEKVVWEERKSGTFKRSFHVPGCQAEDVSASFHNGVLDVTVKKPQGATKTAAPAAPAPEAHAAPAATEAPKA